MAPAAPDSFSTALRREIMRSELKRMRALAILLAILLAVTLATANFLPNFNRRLFEGGLPGWLPLAAIGPFVAYELGALLILRSRITRDSDFPRIARFGNGLVETSLPGVLIMVLSRYMDPGLVFGFWPPLL